MKIFQHLTTITVVNRRKTHFPSHFSLIRVPEAFFPHFAPLEYPHLSQNPSFSHHIIKIIDYYCYSLMCAVNVREKNESHQLLTLCIEEIYANARERKREHYNHK